MGTSSRMANSTRKDEEEVLKFQGRIPYPIPDKIDDWGFNAVQQETKAELFRRVLVSKNAWREEDHDFYTLLRFLRARKYDQDAATLMWMNMMKWRADNHVDTILEDFHFHEKEQFLMCYPQGYHKTDKDGRPVYIQHLGSVNVAKIKEVTTEERMMKFHIQEYERCIKQILPICSHLQNRQIDQTFGILDVKGVGVGHLTSEVRRLLGIIAKCDSDNYPEMLGHICVINAPYLFRPIWNLVKPLLDARTQSKIEICSTDYMPELLKWVDIENIPEYLGGKSKGTLLDDVGPWSDKKLLRTLDLTALGIPRILWPPAATQDDEAPASTASTASTPTQSNTLAASSVLASSPVIGIPGTTSVHASALTSHGSIIYADEEGAYYSPKSEASFYSIPPSPTDTATPLLSSTRTQRQGSGGAPLPVEVYRTVPEGVTTIDTGADSAPRARSIADRVKQLEAEMPAQVDRLKGHLPNGPNSLSNVQRNLKTSAAEGTLLWRVEVLEEGMDMLLAAQQACFKSDSGKARQCCGGCSLM